MNDQRWFVSLIRELCGERGIAISSHCGSWVFRLEKDGQISHLFGYDFSLNSAVAKMLCRDKVAMSELLIHADVPCMEHHIFHGPELNGYVKMMGNWERMLSLLNQHPQGLVCKPNEGTGGQGVIWVKSTADLETAVYETFRTNRSLCLSPFEKIQEEVRITVLKGEVQFLYRKLRPVVTGDGIHTVQQLASKINLQPDTGIEQSVLQTIPGIGEQVYLNWRHNLGQGSKAELLSADDPAWQSAISLATHAVKALSVNVASVDVIQTTSGWKVLEVNSGIMMESLAGSHPAGRELARQFYGKILEQVFPAA